MLQSSQVLLSLFWLFAVRHPAQGKLKLSYVHQGSLSVMFRLNQTTQGCYITLHSSQTTTRSMTSQSQTKSSRLHKRSTTHGFLRVNFEIGWCKPQWRLSGSQRAGKTQPTAQSAVFPGEKRRSLKPPSSSGPPWSYDWKIGSSSHRVETYTEINI